MLPCFMLVDQLLILQAPGGGLTSHCVTCFEVWPTCPYIQWYTWIKTRKSRVGKKAIEILKKMFWCGKFSSFDFQLIQN